MSPPGAYASRIEADGFRWISLPMSRSGVNPFREVSAVIRLARILSREQPDVLHNFTVKSAIYGGLAARMCRVPAVVQAVAGMGYVFSSNSFKAQVLRPLVRQLMRFTFAGRAFRLILQNPDDVNTFLDEGILPGSAIRLIKGSGVDTARFFAPARRDGALTVVLCARLLVEKGVPEFVEAARILRHEERNIRFVLIGGLDPDNPSAISDEQVSQWVAEDLVSWRGHVADVIDILHECHVMALPSFYREGVPRSLIEGAASGLAIITTDLPGCREVVTRDGEDGLWVRPRDASHLAQLIARLDDDRVLLNRVAIAGQRRAVTEFDERSVIDRTIDVYRELTPAMV